MAVFAHTDASVVYNSVDVSDHVVSLDLPISKKQLDTTAMGNTFETAIAGLGSWHGVKLTLQQDYASGEMDATFGPDTIVSASRVLTIKPTSSAVAATNPRYFGNVYIADYRPIGGSVGDLAMCEVTFMAAGALTRATT